jgi:hypothetical protein
MQSESRREIEGHFSRLAVWDPERQESFVFPAWSIIYTYTYSTMTEAIATTAVPEVPPAVPEDDRDKGIARIKKESVAPISPAEQS